VLYGFNEGREPFGQWVGPLSPRPIVTDINLKFHVDPGLVGQFLP